MSYASSPIVVINQLSAHKPHNVMHKQLHHTAAITKKGNRLWSTSERSLCRKQDFICCEFWIICCKSLRRESYAEGRVCGSWRVTCLQLMWSLRPLLLLLVTARVSQSQTQSLLAKVRVTVIDTLHHCQWFWPWLKAIVSMNESDHEFDCDSDNDWW